jgi:hypothetical protein
MFFSPQCPLLASPCASRVEAAAVVRDVQGQCAAAVVERDVDAGRMPVPDGVADRFLSNLQQLVFHARRAAADPAVRGHLDGDRGGVAGHAPERFDEIVGFQTRRPEIPDGAPGLVDALGDLPRRCCTCRSRTSAIAQLPGDDFELQVERAEALQQRVVDVPADAGALGQDERVLVAHGSQPQPLKCPQHATQPVRHSVRNQYVL